MKSALIVHSKHTKNYARLISKKYRDVEFLEVRCSPTEEALKLKIKKDIVIGIGGGSVIDTAKVISRNKRCIAIPTTAAGAAMTPYATIWGKKKMSISAKKPILRMDYNMQKDLSHSIIQSTSFDALSHAIESFWSKKATPKSKMYSKKAIFMMNRFFADRDVNTLIRAGNLAGQAIAITQTNIVHALSYPITLEYSVDHGTACGIVLAHIVRYMDYGQLPGLFKLDSTKGLFVFLKKLFVAPKIKNFDVKLIARRAMGYDRINNGPKEVNKEILEKILRNIIKEI